MAERRLSAGGTTSCIDCHRPAAGYTDGLPTARPGGLNTPSLWGLDERHAFGWFLPDVTTLEAMVLRPLDDPAEMGPRLETTLARLRADPATLAAYAQAFPQARQLVTWEQTGAALAAAVRSIPEPESAYDRYLAGDTEALSVEARRGATLFAELGCTSCHRPPLFATDSYHNVGVAAGELPNNGRARVPTLRGIRYTAPFFHNGSAATLEAVVRAYEQGGQVRSEDVSPAITPLLLTDQDVLDLVAFLSSL